MPIRANNNGHPNDVNSLLEQETANKIRNHKNYLNQKLKGMEDEALKQREINRQMSEYTARQYEQLEIKKRQIQEQIKASQYEKASLSDKLKMVELEQKSLETKIQEAEAYASVARGTESELASQQLLDELVSKRTELLDRQVRLQTAINTGCSVNASLAQKIAYAEQKRAQYKRDMASAELEYRKALENAENPYEREQARYEYKDRVRSINSAPGVSIMDKFSGAFNSLKNIFSGISSKLDVLHDDIKSTVKDTMDVIAKDMSKIDTRLYDANGQSFTNIMLKTTDLVKGNPYLSNKRYLDNVVALTESGIAYNLEQRAYLATMSDKMVTTFDALDSTLTRLVRLQQADVSYSQLGAEARLTSLLNKTFSDTSYLNTMYDSVASALIDSASIMNKENATAYEYAVQKWLGAMYSVGMSESAVSLIAEGLNYLGTGNVGALNSSQSLQTLFAMSASRAGISYADILNNGLSSSTVNVLMKSMVDYLKDIATNTSSNVTRSAFGDIYNLSQSDLRAIRNLTSNDISTVYSNNVTYQAAIDEYNSRLYSIPKRMAISEKVDNAIDNLMFNVGASVLGMTSEDTANAETIRNRYLLFNAEDIAKTLKPIFGNTTAFNLISSLGKGLSEFMTFGATSDLVSNLFGVVSAVYNDEHVRKKLDAFGINDTNVRGGYYTDAKGSITDVAANSLENLVNNYSKGISYSSSSSLATIGNNAIGDKDTLTYGYSEKLKTASASTVVGYDEAGVERTVSDIYAQLFDNQRVIRVSVADYEEKAKEGMIFSFEKEHFKEMVEQMHDKIVNGKVDVDLVDTDVNKIISTTYKVREL